MPVLFSRISHGRIWYEPGQTPGKADKFDGWNGLLQAIKDKTCTPILGSGILDALVGSIREIARRWGADAKALHHEYARARQEFKAALLQVVAFHHPGSPAEVEQECANLLACLG